MENKNQNISAEWVLIALLSVFALDLASRVLLFFWVLQASTSLPVFDIFTIEMLPGFVKASVYWLVGVGVLWAVAHRLGFHRAFVLVGIGAAVSIGLAVLFRGVYINPFWLAAHTLRAALMGWVLWRLAYRQPMQSTGAQGYETTVGRVILALLCGSLVGAAVSMVVLAFTFVGSNMGEFEEIAALVMGFWLGGVFLLAGVPFAVLHALGLRRWYGLTFVGGVVLPLVGLFILNEYLPIEGALVLAVVGSVVGWVIWRVAYRRAPLEG